MPGFAPIGSIPFGGVPKRITLNYALAGSTGAVTLTGSAVASVVARQIAEASSAFALTGSSAAFASARKLAAATGAFDLMGSAAAFNAARPLAAATGAFALTGRNAAFSAARKLAGSTGSFALTGAAANLDAPRRHLDGATGAFALTGSAAAFYDARPLAGGTGAFALTGQSGGYNTARELAGQTGTFALQGSAATVGGLAPPTDPVAILLANAAAGNVPVVGTYYAREADIFDLGYVGVLALNATWQATGSPAGQSLLGLADLLAETDLFGVAAAASMLSWPIVSIGQPDGAGGIAWGGWQKFTPGNYQGRYARFGVVVEAPSAQVQGSLTAFKGQASVDNRTDHYNGLSVPAGGLTINFTPDGATTPAPFNKGPGGAALPFYNVTFNNQPGDQLSVSGLSLDRMTIEILNAGVGVARTVNVLASGY